MADTGGYGPLVPHMRPFSPRRRIEWMGDNPPSKRIYFLRLLRVCVALKTLRCCGDSSSPEQRSTLRGIHTLNPPKTTSAISGGCRPSIRSVSAERKASCGALGGHSRRRRLWLWRLWRQLCFELRLLKNSIKTLKLVVCKQHLHTINYTL
jgi:hypothetical protein